MIVECIRHTAFQLHNTTEFLYPLNLANLIITCAKLQQFQLATVLQTLVCHYIQSIQLITAGVRALLPVPYTPLRQIYYCNNYYAKVYINMQFPWCLCELWWHHGTSKYLFLQHFLMFLLCLACNDCAYQ